MTKNILVGQSGGPTAVINGSLYGVIKEGFRLKGFSVDHIYGMVNGIEGFLKDNYIDLEKEFTINTLEYLKSTPGAYLGSCRCKLPESLDDPMYADLFSKLDALNIEYFFYIGGNDSMDTVSKLSRYAEQIQSSIRFIGIPKTIDNDLVCTDHTPGFGSAAKYVAATVREIAIDASIYANPSVTIIEIMGRHAGWLTASSALARQFEGDNPVMIYLPERNFDLDDFCLQIQDHLKTKQNLVVCVSEGIHDGQGRFVCELDASVGTDNFGHKMLAGAGKYLENYLKQKLGIKVRSVELNVTQRCSSTMISLTDSTEAIEAGSYAVLSAVHGETGKMVAFVRDSNNPYRLSLALKDVNEICNKEKSVPAAWITPNGSDVTEEMVEYIKPLIYGDIQIPLKGGLPEFIYRKQS